MTDYPPLHTTRIFDAPSKAVWDAWTNPEQFKQWYMPAPFSIAACEFDLRPGGKLRVDTQAPDGSIMPMSGEFKVVEEPLKLIMTNSPLDASGEKLFEIQHTLVFTEENGKTTLHITYEVLSAGPQADQFLAGMQPGLERALNQLADVLIK